MYLLPPLKQSMIKLQLDSIATGKIMTTRLKKKFSFWVFHFQKLKPEVLSCMKIALLEYRIVGLSKISRDHQTHALVPLWQFSLKKPSSSWQATAALDSVFRSWISSRLEKWTFLLQQYTTITEYAIIHGYQERILFFCLEQPFYKSGAIFLVLFFQSSFV